MTRRPFLVAAILVFMFIVYQFCYNIPKHIFKSIIQFLDGK